MNKAIKSVRMDDSFQPPSSFIQNQGQEDHRVSFTAQIQGRQIFFLTDRIMLTEMKPAVPARPMGGITGRKKMPQEGVALELSFSNANAGIGPVGQTRLPGYYHYFKGNNQKQWLKDVAAYQELHYPNVWDGVGLEIAVSSAGLKLNWVLRHPKQVSLIKLKWAGARHLELDENGHLLIHHELGTLMDPAPIAYQEINGERVSVACQYFLRDFEFGFELTGNYDPDLPVVIDPIIQFSTFLGESSVSEGNGVAVDAEGCAYLTGYTNSLDFPVTPGAFQTTNDGDSSVVITKFAADGASLVYSTLLGGTNVSYGFTIAVDTTGHAYVAGHTLAADFPVTPGAFQTAATSSTMGFITKLSPDGSALVYSTYLGGDAGTNINSIGLDDEESAYVTGITQSATFPVTPNAFQPTLQGYGNAFVTKFAPDGGSLIYSTYLGGSDYSYGTAITIDDQKFIYLGGITSALDFPVTPGAFQTTSTGTRGFITKFAADGESLVYSTYLGGTDGFSRLYAIAVDQDGHACVTGDTNDLDFPVTAGAFQTTNTGLSVFATKLSADGSYLVGSTYLGGTTDGELMTQQITPTGETGYSIAVDGHGRIYLTGGTYSTDFPITPQVIPSAYGGDSDAFVSVLSADLSNLLVSFYLGGSGFDRGTGIVLDQNEFVYTVGITTSANFPVTAGSYQDEFGDSLMNIYLTKLEIPFFLYQGASMTVKMLL